MAGRFLPPATAGACLAALLLVSPGAAPLGPASGFGFFRPDVVLTPEERGRLRRGAGVVRALPATDGQLAVFAAVALDAPPAWLAAWAGSRGHRLAEPPVPHDFDGLALAGRDLEALRTCRAGDCRIKLAAPDIAALREVRAAAGGAAAAALNGWFREMALRRVQAYRGGGLGCLWPYVDRAVPIRPKDAIGTLLVSSRFLRLNAPAVVEDLVGYPVPHAAPGTSLLHWERQPLGGVPAVTITHTRLYEPRGPAAAPAFLAVSLDVYASHYRTGSLSVVALVHDGGAGYVAYLNRSQVDALRGPMGAVRRRGHERAAERDAQLLLREIQAQLAGDDR